MSSIDNSSNAKCFALQWNIRGLRANIHELKQLIAKHSPSVIALHETKASNNVIPKEALGKKFQLFLETGNRSYWQQGVGLAVREGTPFEHLETNSELQAIAIRVQLPLPITVVSVYIPPNTPRCKEELDTLLDHLPSPILMLGDFNAHHPGWGSSSASTLGRFIAETTLDRDMIILNNGSPTRTDPATGGTSAIDLSICSKELAARFIWRVLPDTCNSDHHPITLSIPGHSQTITKRQRWLSDEADWTIYERLTATTIKPGEIIELDTFVEHVIAAATNLIPRTSGRSAPKAWWCPGVKIAIKTFFNLSSGVIMPFSYHSIRLDNTFPNVH